jgi:transposase
MIGLKAHNIARYYLDVTSDFAKNKEKYKDIAKTGMIIPENMWVRLCLDEVDLCGQVYTILSNTDRRNWIIAILPWTKAEPFIARIREKIPQEKLDIVMEIACDMSSWMEKIVNTLFSDAALVTDRFHFMKEVLDDLQTVRKVLKTERKKIDNEERLKVREAKKKWETYIYEPRRSFLGETYLEMLSYCMYQCNIRKSERSSRQQARYRIMKWLSEFDELVACIDIIQELFLTLDQAKQLERSTIKKEEIQEIGRKKLTKRLELAKKEQKKCPIISAMIKTTQVHFDGLTNYFISLHSTAYAEWLHSRIRELIQNVRWFRNKDYMMYRILRNN